MIFDSHMHTKFSADSDMLATDALARARSLNLGVVFTEHFDYGVTGDDGCAPATVYFPSQVYRAGYCPCEALSRGTLFPELASDYPTCPRGEGCI